MTHIYDVPQDASHTITLTTTHIVNIYATEIFDELEPETLTSTTVFDPSLHAEISNSSNESSEESVNENSGLSQESAVWSSEEANQALGEAFKEQILSI